jgi:predicted nucleic acid-binding protein
LLGLAQAGAADWLVTGDKRDLLGLRSYGRARIVTVRTFLSAIGRPS